MNFLSHAYLAEDDDALVVGGVIGDWIKGPLPGQLPANLARGVALHRAIDSYSNGHAAFRASRARISDGRRRYAGVLVDIFYDHVLALTWTKHHPQSLPAYSATIYARIAACRDGIPSIARRPLRLMAEEDWFVSYASVDGIRDVLARMSRRARQPNPLAGAEHEFLMHAGGFMRDFDSWLKDARGYVRAWRAQNV